ncbi:hypothetical protein ACWF9G_23105 [Nocardia sp. NPDC055029]
MTAVPIVEIVVGVLALDVEINRVPAKAEDGGVDLDHIQWALTVTRTVEIEPETGDRDRSILHNAAIELYRALEGPGIPGSSSRRRHQDSLVGPFSD